MNWVETEPRHWVDEHKMVEMYQCDDDTWRVTGYPYHDKVRNLHSREEAEQAAMDWCREHNLREAKRASLP